MADTFYINLTPTDTTPLWGLWKLVRALTAAGYTIKACGDGTSFKVAGVSGVADPIAPGSADDLWTTFASVGTSAWICLAHPTLLFNLVFWRNTTNTAQGRVIVGKQAAFTAAGFPLASATDPGTIPGTAGYVRGSGIAWGDWFGGSTYVVGRWQIAVKDVAGPAAGAWYIVGMTPTYSVGGSFAHHMRFTALDPYTTGAGTDPEPYVFFSVSGPTSGWGSYYMDGSYEVTSDGLGGTTGFWHGYGYGGSFTTFGGCLPIPYSSTYPLPQYVPLDLYSTTVRKYYFDRFIIAKEQTGAQERKGWTRSCWAVGWIVPHLALFETLLWFKMALDTTGSSGYGDAVLFWDGVTAEVVY